MIISRTPFRVSLFGGGTDFKDYYTKSSFGYGTVISTAINMYTYITVNKRIDDKIRVGYSKTEYVDSVDEIEHNIVREAMRITGVEKGVDIIYMADIPLDSAGIGLASSSALAVGVLNALYAYNCKHATSELLARNACEIEIDRLNNPIGKQDQYAVAYGGFRRYQFNNDGTVYDDPVIIQKDTLEELQSNLLFFYTGLTRKSSSVLKEQKENINSRMYMLDNLVEIADEAVNRLQNNDLSEIGFLLDKTWLIKKQMASNISNSLIDDMYEEAKRAGAVGGKILGAGGGGFLMLYVPKDKQDSVRKNLSKYNEMDIQFEPQGSKIIYVG